MPPRGRLPPVDHETLAEYLNALAYPVRLQLLDALRFPHTLADIKVPPLRLEPGGNPERPATRETLRAHLDKLRDAELVKVEQESEGGRKVNRYVVNPQKLYAITEELRRLSTMYAGRGLSRDATGTLDDARRSERVAGPRLVLVHGVYEGKAFPLRPDTAQGGAWTVGRRLGLPVSLDYDPYVSLENSVLTEQGRGFRVSDLPASKNGTWVNWEPLPRASSRDLEPGDLVGVGRSLLLFLAR